MLARANEPTHTVGRIVVVGGIAGKGKQYDLASVRHTSKTVLCVGFCVGVHNNRVCYQKLALSWGTFYVPRWRQVVLRIVPEFGAELVQGSTA